MMTNRKSMGWRGGLVYGAIFGVVGYFIIFHLAMDTYRMGRASESWPSVQGQIIHSAVASTRPSAGKMSYSANIRFTYRVDGKQYQSSQLGINPGPGAAYKSDPAIARNTVKRYPMGQAVTVYYNPVKPSLGILQPGITHTTKRILEIGAVFAFIAIWIALSGITRSLFGISMFSVVTFAWLRKKRDHRHS